MAKRNANDRNQRVVAARQEKASGVFVTTDGSGRIIKLKDKPSLIFIQQTMHDVVMPEVPTYEVVLGPNRTKSYPVDAIVIKQTEDPIEKAELRRKWMQYQSDLTDASMELSMRSTAAVFYEGTEPDEAMADGDARWLKRVKIAGWKIPEDSDEKWVFYLQTSLTEDDVKNLSAAVIRRTGGVSEELIQAAEETFLSDVQADEGAGDMEDAETDSE